MEIVKQEDIDESEIHQDREIRDMQYSHDMQHWWSNDDPSGGISDTPMYGKFKRYAYTDGSVSLPILSVEVNNEQSSTNS